MSKNQRELRMVSMRLYAEDIDELKRFFPEHGYNLVVREKIHQLVRALQEREQEALTKLEGDINAADINII